MRISLSKYFPKDTEYFYAFPVGEESSFFSEGPAWKEELIAARALVCAGDNVKVMLFASTREPESWRLLERFGTPKISDERIITLPPRITAYATGKRRNILVKDALRHQATPGKLVMAQPFLDPELEHLYQINPGLSVWCNDKKNLPAYIAEEYLPERYFTCENGEAFFSYAGAPPLPCVVKVSSSSSGDGVRICRTAFAFEAAKKKFRSIGGTILVEECIDVMHNVGIQFGIPHNLQEPMEIIGVNEQLTTPGGEYIGAIVDESKKIPSIDRIVALMLEKILPNIRARGWYGVGGFDVLIGKNGRLYFIDCNFRMTAITSYLCLLKEGFVHQPIMTFTGSFVGTEADFLHRVAPLADRGNPEQVMQIIAINRHRDSFNFNAALYVEDRTQLPYRASQVLNQGIDSAVLKRFQKAAQFDSIG